MAEFGTFAAALQIADTGLKLKKLWSDIRHAPKDLDELVEEVILQAEVLGRLRQLVSLHDSHPDNETWQKCQEQFERCVNSLQALVDDLSLIRHNHPKTGPLRLHLRSGDVKKCRERLQRAQAMVTMSVAVMTCLTLDKSQHLGKPQSRSIANTRRKTQPCRLGDKSRSSTAKTNSFTSKKRRPPVVNHRNSTSSKSNAQSLIRFRFPSWTVWKCVYIWMHRGSLSFDISLRIYNTRPNDSELFKLSRNGDWTQVRHMLARRVASPFDVDEWGTTLLHIAAGQARPEVCRFLLAQGLDASCRTWQDNRTPLETLALAFRPVPEDEPKSTASLDTTQLLLTSGRNANVDYSSEPKHWLHRCSLPARVLSVLIAAVVPHYNTVDPAIRARLAMATTASDPDSIAVLLGHGLSLEQAFKLASAKPVKGYGHRQLLFNASRCLAKLDPRNKRRAGWLSIVKSIVSFETQNQSLLSTVSIPFRSLYLHYIVFHLSGYHSSPSSQKTKRSASLLSSGKEATWNEHLISIGKTWLQILVDCGADLDLYSKAEKRTLLKHTDNDLSRLSKSKKRPPPPPSTAAAAQHKHPNDDSLDCCSKADKRKFPNHNHAETIIWRHRNMARCFRLKFLLCGKRIDDWKVFVVPAVHTYRRAGNKPGDQKHVCCEGHVEYEMAGAFWNFVENPELFGVPGAFLSDLEDEDDEDDGGSSEGKPVNVRGSIF